MLAALLDLPQATFASKVEMGDGKAKVTPQIDGASRRSRSRCRRSCHPTAPQRAALSEIAGHHEGEEKADQTVTLSSLGVRGCTAVKVVKTVAPAGRSKGQMLQRPWMNSSLR